MVVAAGTSSHHNGTVPNTTKVLQSYRGGTAITTLHLSSQLAAVRHPTKGGEGQHLINVQKTDFLPKFSWDPMFIQNNCFKILRYFSLGQILDSNSGA